MAEFTEEACSQSSQLGEDELQKLEEESIPKNTKQQTSWGIRKFEKWCQRRRIVCDLAVVGATDLSSILRRFYAEVKTIKDKKDLTPSALTGIRAAVHRTITSQPISRPINILRGCLYGSRAGPLTGITRLARSRCVIYFIIKIPLRLYGLTGWPAWRDLA